jgi:hypothetical protein
MSLSRRVFPEFRLYWISYGFLKFPIFCIVYRVALNSAEFHDFWCNEIPPNFNFRGSIFLNAFIFLKLQHSWHLKVYEILYTWTYTEFRAIVP